MSTPKVEFSDRLRIARERRGLNQTALAEKAGMQVSAVAHFEGGRRKPSIKNLVVLAVALDVTTDSLLGLGDSQEASSVLPKRFARSIGELTTANLDLLEAIAREMVKRQ